MLAILDFGELWVNKVSFSFWPQMDHKNKTKI